MQAELDQAAHFIELIPQQIDVLGKCKNKQQLADLCRLNADTAEAKPALIAAVLIAIHDQ